MTEIQFSISGMHCIGCQHTIEQKLLATEGIHQISVSYETGKAVISFDETFISFTEIKEIIHALDYTVLPEKQAAESDISITIGATIFRSYGNNIDTELISSQSENNLPIAEGQNLVIPVNEVTETAQFYPVEIDGTEMEVFAVRDKSGNIRTAFNTCQSCYTSGRGYYVANGSVLICQNCGSQFSTEQVQIQAGGCNPYPIFAENKDETAESITISYDFLKQSASIFANWKTR